MKLSYVIEQLIYGELKNLSIKDDKKAIVSYINLALVSLYSRFPIKTGELLIDLKDNLVEYGLSDEVMTIDSIYDEDGELFELNNPDSIFSINVIGYNTIQVPNPSTGATISVIYKSAPTLLIYIDDSSLQLDVPIPPQLLEPLLHYVGYRAHSAMDANIKSENNTHYMRYEASCRRIENLGLIRRPVPSYRENRSEGISEINEEV